MKMLQKDMDEDKEIERIFGLPENGLSGSTIRSAVQDRDAKDLDVPWHAVSMYQQGRWEASDFKADPAAFKLENIPEEERERLSELSCGNALRE
jgi:hypothetical protein